MKTLNVVQGSPEWLAVRKDYKTASEAPAAVGVHKYMSRTDLLKQKQTGIVPQVDQFKQKLFDRGHESEHSSRPFAEHIIGADLYPVTGTIEIDGLKLLASFDGITLDESIIFEHKLWSEPLAAAVRAGALEPHYTVQMDQQLMVSGADKCLFMVSDGTEEKMVFMWYQSSQQKFLDLIAAWKAFDRDLETYLPVQIEEKPQAKAVVELPALVLQAEGRLVNSNLAAFRTALAKHLEETRALVYVTDEDFSNAAAVAKMYRETCKKLELAKEQMLAQTVSIDEAFKVIDACHDDLRTTALQIEKDVEKNTQAKKVAIINEAKVAFTAHITELEAGIAPIRLQSTMPNFADAIKGKRLFSAMDDAAKTMLANAKIEHSRVAACIAANLNWLKQHEEHRALLADLQTIVYKPTEDFQLTVTSRIDAYKRAEEAKIEAAKAEAAAKAVAEERARAEAAAAVEAARVKAEADALAKQQADAAEKLFVPEPVAAVQPLTVSPTVVSTAAQASTTTSFIEVLQSVAPAQVTAAFSQPTLRLGQIGDRLGFALTADFLRQLGFEHAAKDKAALLYHEHQFPQICAALIQRIQSVAQQHRHAA